MKYLTCLFILSISILRLSAQKREKLDIVYLSNGSIIQGISEVDSLAQKIKIKILGGSLLVYSLSEVDSIQFEIRKQKFNIIPYKEDIPISSRPKGIYHLLFLSHHFIQDRLDDIYNFSASYTIGYSFSSHLNIGVGLSLDPYSKVFYVTPYVPGIGPDRYIVKFLYPVFLDFRGDLTKAAHTPFYFLNTGWALGGEKSEFRISNHKGGFMFQGGLGMKFNTRRKLEYLFSLSYRYQQTDQEFETYPNNHFGNVHSYLVSGNINYHSMVFSFGIGL